MSRFKKGRKPKTKVDQALSIAKSNRKEIRKAREVDGNILGGTATAMVNTGTVIYEQPVGADQGFTIATSSIRVKAMVYQDVASAITDFWRVDLVLDKIPNGANATLLDMYSSATPQVVALKNFTLKGRFKILRSMMGAFNESGVLAQSLDWYVKLNYKTVSSVKGAYGIANITRNALFLVFWTTAGAN